MMCLGDVVALDEDSADLSGFRNYRFIDEVEQALLHPAVRSPKAHGHMLRHVALTRPVNLIKKLKEPLSADFRQGLSNGPAGYVATVDEPHIGFVDKLKNVLGPTQNGDESRSAFEQAPLPFGLRGEDRKSTRLNSSHANISYAVFCLKKKKKKKTKKKIYNKNNNKKKQE